MVIVLSSIVVDSIDSIPGTVKKKQTMQILCNTRIISGKEKILFGLGLGPCDRAVSHVSFQNTMEIKFRNTQLMSFSFFGVTVLVNVVRYFDILLFYFSFVGIVIYCTVASIWCFYICNLYFSIIRRYSKYNLI